MKINIYNNKWKNNAKNKNLLSVTRHGNETIQYILDYLKDENDLNISDIEQIIIDYLIHYNKVMDWIGVKNDKSNVIR